MKKRLNDNTISFLIYKFGAYNSFLVIRILGMGDDLKLDQIELFTELTTYVGIVPSFSEEQLYLMSGEIQKFKANHEITVPLWLALLFKKQQKCKIIPPHWMKLEKLLEIYNQQNSKTEPELINLQSPQFFEISYMILNNAPDDFIENPTKIRNLIDSLRDLRQKIILQKLRSNGGFLINHVTSYEINKFRNSKNMIMRGLNELNKIKDASQS